MQKLKKLVIRKFSQLLQQVVEENNILSSTKNIDNFLE